MYFFFFFFFVIAVSSIVAALPLEDEVLVWPGYDGPKLPRTFSGYVNDSLGGHVHYMMFLASGDGLDWRTAPVLAPSNGGPFCSSLEYATYEGGALQFFPYQGGPPKNASAAPFAINPYSLTNLGNLLIASHPPGTAFSYVLNRDDMATNDTKNALSYFNTLKSIFETKFPELRKNDLYTGGESYSGIIGLLLAEHILDFRDAKSTSDTFKNYRGVFEGNGVTSAKYDDNFAYSAGSWAVSHGFMLQSEYDAIVPKCIPVRTPECDDAWDDLYDRFPNMDIYNSIGYCYNPPAKAVASGTKPRWRENRFRNIRKRRNPAYVRDSAVDELEALNEARVARAQAEAEAASAGAGAGAGTVPIQAPVYNLPCSDEVYLRSYFGRDDVKKALHVPLNLKPAVCYDGPYTKNVDSVVHIWERMRQRGLVTVIMNGLADTIVPYTGTYSWLAHETNWKQTHELSQWTYEADARPAYGPQVGGLVTILEHTVIVGLFPPGGHMLPQTQPQRFLSFMRRIINGTFFPEAKKLATPRVFKPPMISYTPPPPPHQFFNTEMAKGIGVGVGLAVALAAVCFGAWYMLSGRAARKPSAVDAEEAAYKSMRSLE